MVLEKNHLLCMVVLSLMVLCCTISLAESFLITTQPESQTVDPGESITFSVEATGVSSDTPITWYFSNPKTGESYTGRQLSMTVQGVKVKNPNSLNITLKDVPEELHEWTVYCHIGTKSSGIDSETAYIYISGKSISSDSAKINTTKEDTEDPKEEKQKSQEWDTDAIIVAMMDNITGTELQVLDRFTDNSPIRFEQKVEYDPKTNRFIHYVSYANFLVPGYVLSIDDLDSEAAKGWYDVWTRCRRYAELWLLKDVTDTSFAKGCTVVMKFVTSLDENADNYLEVYTVSMKDFKVSVITNIFTDEYEPVGFEIK